MIYLCSMQITGANIVYFYNENFIYSIIKNTDINTPTKYTRINYARQEIDVPNSMLVPNTHEWVLESQFPIYDDIPNDEIHITDSEGLFNILNKIIFNNI